MTNGSDYIEMREAYDLERDMERYDYQRQCEDYESWMFEHTWFEKLVDWIDGFLRIPK